MDRQQILDMVRADPQIAERAREQMDGVLVRSATDPEFRQQLLSDSRPALSQHFGREIPAGVNIAFVESAPGTATMVLPDFVGAEAELSETELEAVAGGSLTGIEIAVVALVAVSFYALGDAMN